MKDGKLRKKETYYSRAHRDTPVWISKLNMFIADKLIYLELQKTGCTHLDSLFDACIQGEISGKHNRIPVDLDIKDKLIVGSIRNPWDWYVSLWAYGCTGAGNIRNNLTGRHIKSHIFQLRSSPFKALFGIQCELLKPVSVWLETYSDSEDVYSFRKWLKMIYSPARKHDIGEDYGLSSVSCFAGLLTYRYLRLYSRDISYLYSNKRFGNFNELREYELENNVLDFTIHTESLEEGFIQILRRAGYELSDEMLRYIYSRKKINVSDHEVTALYYDKETTDLVSEKERLIVEKYGYAPPDI